MRRWIGSVGRILSYILTYSPSGLRHSIGVFLGFLWFDIFRIRRQVVLDNIAIAFPEMPTTERVRLGRRSLRHLGINFLDYSLLPWLTKANYEQYFEFHNDKIVEELLARGKGVLMLTLHLGHGDMACAGLSLRGYPITMVSKFFKARWLNDLWFGMRERLGTRFVAPRDSSYALLKALKSGRVVIIPLDQFTGPPIGVRSRFFGRETGTAAGLAVMAERSKAPVLCAYTYRGADGRHVIECVGEVPAGDAPAEVVTQRFNDELEKIVRSHPDQWMWIHKRWKKFKY